MGCDDCTRAYELIHLPVGSSKDAVKSARKEWPKTLHPDVWQNRPGWRGAANQLTNINVAIDHLLQCEGAGSTSNASYRATPNCVSEADVSQVLRQASEALRQAMKSTRKSTHANQTQAEAGAAWRGVVERDQKSDKGKEETGAKYALKARTKGWIKFTGLCVLFVLPLFPYLTTSLFSSDQVDASNQEPMSFTLQPSGIQQSKASESSPMQAAPAVEEAATVEKDNEQPEESSVTSLPAPVPAASSASASTESQPSVLDEAQLEAGRDEKACGVNVQEWNLNCQKYHAEVSVTPRPAYVPVTIKVMDDLAVPAVPSMVHNQYGFATRGTAPVGYATTQQPAVQPTIRATTLILSNGPPLYVTNVRYSGERILFTMPDGSRRSLGLEQVNFLTGDN